MLNSRFRLIGVNGLLRLALGAIDVAAWDARAKLAGLPLAELLGGEIKPVPAYASFFMDGMSGAERDAARAREKGFRAVKFKIGYPSVDEDLEVIGAARRILGDDARIMVDYNQALDVDEAISRLVRLADLNVYWAEEPTCWDDIAANAEIARQSPIPIQIGENWWNLKDMVRSIAGGGSSYAMLNLPRIGGVSGWVKAAELAAEAKVPLSSHTYQTVCSHLLCATPTAHWLEYSGKTNPILARHLEIADGCVVPLDGPGSGLEWDEQQVSACRIA